MMFFIIPLNSVFKKILHTLIVPTQEFPEHFCSIFVVRNYTPYLEIKGLIENKVIIKLCLSIHSVLDMQGAAKK